jgi:hypothetical protein
LSSPRRFRCGCPRTKSNTYVLRDPSVRGGVTRTCRACRRAASNRYGRSAKGRATKARYQRSRKGRAANKRFNDTKARRAAAAAYRRSPKGFAARLRSLGVLNRKGQPITAEDLAAEKRRTRGRCALCGEPGRPGDRLVVDHSHQTGLVRGWIHDGENVAEGHMRRAGVLTDDPGNLPRLLEWARALHALAMRGRKP